jgi:DNA-binding CsgD family transcriptional regulator/PAS domain-containing protein
MPRLDDFSAIVESLYAAAADASQWPAALGLIQRAFAAHSAALTFQHPSRRTGTRVVSGYQLGDEKRYFAGYSVQNLLFEARLRQPTGRPSPSHDLVDPREMERTLYYAEWMRPRDIYFPLGVLLSRSNDETQWLSINRNKASGGFSVADVSFLELLLPHLQRAIGLTRQLGAISAAQSAAETLLGTLDQALLLLNRHGRVVFANKAAGRQLSSKDGIQAVRGNLTATCPDAASRLAHLVARAARDTDGRGRRGGTLRLPRQASPTPLIAVLTPLLAESETWVPNNPAVAVLLNDPVRPRELPQETLRTTFNLTPAESKLAALLANGHLVSEAADLLHITRETARTHLSRTLSKTGTRRQAELIRLLLNLSPTITGGQGSEEAPKNLSRP